MVRDLDDVDRGILHLLQENAREATGDEMADAVGVAASTVRNRIELLEEGGVIRSYHPEIDYEQAGFELHVLVVCRAPPRERTELARQIRDLPGVVRVREMMTGSENVHVEAVGLDADTVDELTEGIDELGIEIVRSDVIKTDHIQPFNHFGQDVVGE